MKNIAKLIAVIAITALTVFSCAPEVDVTDYDWAAANAPYDPSRSDAQGIGVYDFSFDNSVSASAKNPEITINFPGRSDFLRADNVEQGLKAFLTVHNFTNPPAVAGAREASTLSAAIDYKLVNRAGTAVTIEVSKEFTGVYSDLVVKLDAGKYKHSNGLLLDGDRNGTAGEAGYDDIYWQRYLSGSDSTSWVAPGNRGWYFSIDTPGSGTWANATATTTTLPSLTAGTLYNVPGDATIRGQVAGLITGGLKIEKLVNGVWTAEGAAAEFDTTANNIVFKNVTFGHNNVYRITWNGSAKLETSGSYYGVRQRISVRGATPNTSASPWDNNKARYSLTKVSGAQRAVYNPDIVSYISNNSANLSTSPYSFDLNNSSLVLDVEFPIREGATAGTYVGLDSASLGLAKFKESFKIAYSQNYSDFDSLKGDSDIIYIDITKVEAIEDFVPGSTTVKVINKLRITFDPAYQFIQSGNYYFLINDGLGYTGGKYVFGNLDNAAQDNFELYDLSSGGPPPSAGTETDPIPLTANTWTDGNNITTSGGELWYSFSVVTNGTYYVSWNDSFEGDYSKTLDVKVSAYYSDGSTIFTGEDSGWSNPQSFTASQSGTVKIKVEPYTSGNTGTFAVAYYIY